MHRSLWYGRQVVGWLLAGLVLCGCVLPGQPAPPVPTVTGQHFDSEWRAVAPGIERRDMMFLSEAGFQAAAVLVRMDPSLVRFEVRYRPGDPPRLDQWRDMLPGAAVIVNGGFFNETGHALGLLISEGQSFGQSYTGFGGMFQVAGTSVRLRSLAVEPYQPGEALSFAVQSYPMLIETGGLKVVPRYAGFDQRDRRTAIGQDRAGRVLFVVIPYHLVTLFELQEWLLTPELDLDIAFGLDGGRSTGLFVTSPSGGELFPALDRLPDVIVVYANPDQ